MKLITFFSLLLFGLLATEIEAQRFGAGLTLGANFAQIDGDQMYGFNKFGYNGGVFALINIGRLSQIEIDFLYSRRGSHNGSRDNEQNTIDLHYLEIPVLYKYKDWESEDSRGRSFHRVCFTGGLSLGRLIKSSSLTGIDQAFKKNDLSWILGVQYYFDRNWSSTFRFTNSILPLHRYSDKGVDFRMISYFLSLNLNYQF